jgi:Protein of unknown function (DUF3298)
MAGIKKVEAAGLVLIALVWAACGGHTGGNSAAEQHSTGKAIVLETLTGNWYKHFTGTIAGKAVCVNLYHYNSEIRGTYYYNDVGEPIGLFNGEDSTKNDVGLYLSEDPETERDGTDDYTQNAHWVAMLSGDRLTGKWISRDGKKTYDIDLKEDYPVGTFRFDVLMSDSSAGYGIALGHSAYQISTPDAAIDRIDRYFLDTVVRRYLGCDTAEDIAACMKAGNARYLSGFLEDVDSTDTDPNDSLSHSGESTMDLWVMYNEQNMVVLESLDYEYMGGAHGIYASSFTCADVQEKKVWELGDILTVDSTKLTSLLEQEARRQFGIKPGKDLSDRMLVDTIPVTHNIYFTRAGITFNYAPYEIASFADGEVSLFIPYNRLMDMLRPEFKKRMGI